MSEYKVLHNVNEYGTEFPWAEYKQKSKYVAKLMKEIVAEKNDTIYTDKIVERVENCSQYLTFAKEDEESPFRLQKAYYCNNRLCYTCNALKARKIYQKVLRLMDNMMWDNPKGIKYMHVSLTVKNVEGKDIRSTFDKMGKAWSSIVDQAKRKHKKYKFEGLRKLSENYLGYFRSYEVTYNPNKKTYHPHIHAIFALRNDDNEITTAELKEIWKHYMKLDYNPEVEIFMVQEKGAFDICQSVANIAKYMTKGIDVDLRDLIKKDAKALIETIGREMKNLKTITYQGIFKDYNMKLNENESCDDSDLESVGFMGYKLEKEFKNKLAEANIKNDNVIKEVGEEIIKNHIVNVNNYNVKGEAKNILVELNKKRELARINFELKMKLFDDDFLFSGILTRKLERRELRRSRKSFVPNIIEQYKYIGKMKQYILIEIKNSLDKYKRV